MKRYGLFIIFLLIFIHAGLVWGGDYTLGPGDVVDISVWGHEELQVKNLLIRPDGKIAFPLLGEVQAEGKTPASLAEKLVSDLIAYINNPKVTVNVVNLRTIRVYVLGEVNKPGMYEIVKSHSLLDSLGMAGGFTKYAARKAIYVIHKKEAKYERINLNNLLKKGDLTQNVELDEGDIVYLASNGVNFINDILPYITAAYQIKIISRD